LAGLTPPTGLQRPPLDPFYYLDNFEAVLATIRARYTDLLTPEESRFVTEFPTIQQRSRALLARMVMRRGVLFRASRLSYREIGDTRAAAGPLIECGWVTDRPLLDIDDLQSILPKQELIRSLRLPRRYAGWRKPDLVAVLKAQFPEPREFAHWCPGTGTSPGTAAGTGISPGPGTGIGRGVGTAPGTADTVYSLLVSSMCERFRLMFFGNERQGWSDFVTADLKIFRYEKVQASLHARPFQSRAQVELFERLQECGALLRAGMPLDDLIPLVPPMIADSEWLETRRQTLIFAVAREYERAGDRGPALALYLNCTHRGARMRAIRLQSRAHAWDATRALCMLALDQPESTAELQFIRRVLPRANRKLGIPGDAGYAPPPIPEFGMVLEGDPQLAPVECRVRDHLARDLIDGNTVRYVENGLVNALFGLLCWPAIFAAVPGAFFHDFHREPADMASGDFYRRRRREFDECLSQLESGGYRQSIWHTFRQKWGIESPFVRWHALDKPLLRWALECFPAAHLRRWFEWIVRDVKENRAGFPDLVQFWPGQRTYRMIEVKGPGDRIQDNQRRLLEYCVSHGMPVAICRVRWTRIGSSGDAMSG
jgi:hypothetical protein